MFLSKVLSRLQMFKNYYEIEIPVEIQSPKNIENLGLLLRLKMLISVASFVEKKWFCAIKIMVDWS